MKKGIEEIKDNGKDNNYLEFLNEEVKGNIESLKIKRRFMRYMTLILIVIFAIVGFITYTTYKNMSAKQEQQEGVQGTTSKDFDNLTTQLNNYKKTFDNAYAQFDIHRISTSNKYLEILTRSPKTVQALNDCNDVLKSMQSVYSKLQLFSNSPSISNESYKAEIKDAQRQIEICNNELYANIEEYNAVVIYYNDWASDVMVDPKAKEYVTTNEVQMLSRYYSTACSYYIDLNNDGDFEGKP